MAMKMAATALFLVLAIVPSVLAETYTVGDTSGWKMNVDYTVWAAGKTFRIGDILVFKYAPSHSVNEVSKSVYDTCGGAAIKTHSDADGSTEIELDTLGLKYFICPTTGHCEGGQKLSITVEDASVTPATPTPPSSTPATPPTTGSTTTPPPKGSGATKGVMSFVLVGVSMVLGYGLMM